MYLPTTDSYSRECADMNAKCILETPHSATETDSNVYAMLYGYATHYYAWQRQPKKAA